MAELDKTKLTTDLMAELNLDNAEQTTVAHLVDSSVELVQRSVGNLNPDDPIAVQAIKTMATQLYYDRSLSQGLSKGLVMMLVHLQNSESTGDVDGHTV